MNYSYNDPSYKELRRDLRKHGTPAEAILWRRIKTKQVEGLLFKRQYGVDGYILDFFCPAIRIAIELDGGYHHDAKKNQQDAERDSCLLEEHGILTLRYPNKVVLEDINKIVNQIQYYEEEFERRGGWNTPPP